MNIASMSMHSAGGRNGLKVISRTRLRLSTGILLASCLGTAVNGWADCLNAGSGEADCGGRLFAVNDSDLRFDLELATLPGSQLAALPDSVLAFDDLRFQFPEVQSSFQTIETSPTGPEATQETWNGPASDGFAFFIGNVARLDSSGSLSLGSGRPENESPYSSRNSGGSSDLDVDLGLSYDGADGFSSSFGLAEKIGNYDADPGVVGQFRYRF